MVLPLKPPFSYSLPEANPFVESPPSIQQVQAGDHPHSLPIRRPVVGSDWKWIFGGIILVIFWEKKPGDMSGKKKSSNLTACYDIDGPFNDVRRTYPQNIDIYIYIHTYIYIYNSYVQLPAGSRGYDFAADGFFMQLENHQHVLKNSFPSSLHWKKGFRWPRLGCLPVYPIVKQTSIHCDSWLNRWILYFWWLNPPFFDVVTEQGPQLVALEAAKPWIGPIRAKPNAAQSWANQLGMERIFAGMGQYV